MRIEQLTFTRFIAAISIVVFHYGQHVFPFNGEKIHFLFSQANIGVSFFFILSGFVMVIAYGKKDRIAFPDFIRKRFARIYPVYVLAILLIVGYYISVNSPVDFKALMLNISLLQSWIPDYPGTLNAPGWSLSVEMFFYLCFPLLFNVLYKKIDLLKMATLVLIIFMVSQVVFHLGIRSSFYHGLHSSSHDVLFYSPYMHINEFLVGNIAGFYFLRGMKERNYDLPIIILVACAVYLLKWKTGLNYHNGLLAIVFVPMIMLLSANNGYITKLFRLKSAVFLGEISYSIYILQLPVFAGLYKLMVYLEIEDPVIHFYTGLIALIIISSISYLFFETPLRKMINRAKRGNLPV